MKLSPNFSEEEFVCPCCGLQIVKLKLVDSLQALRDLAGRPIHVLSGCRCPVWNAKVGGAKQSQHLLLQLQHQYQKLIA